MIKIKNSKKETVKDCPMSIFPLSNLRNALEWGRVALIFRNSIPDAAILQIRKVLNQEAEIEFEKYKIDNIEIISEEKQAWGGFREIKPDEVALNQKGYHYDFYGSANEAHPDAFILNDGTREIFLARVVVGISDEAYKKLSPIAFLIEYIFKYYS